jgi:general secretion pathway protein K
MTINRAEKGGALLAVLWMSAALAAIAFTVSTTVRSEIDRVSGDSEGLRAHYLASGSVERAIQYMLWGGDYRNPDGSPRFWDFTQPRLTFRYASGDAIVQIMPESSKLSVNTATVEDLAKVIAAVGGPQAPAAAIAQAIIEWRGGGNSLDSFYLSFGPTFRPRHASFQEIEELLSVRGVTSELFYGSFVEDAQGRLYARGGLRDCLSVWGSPAGPFDANSVSPALLDAMGVPGDVSARLMALRPTTVFRTPADLAAAGINSPRLTVGGNSIWSIRANARLRHPDGSPSDVVRSAGAVVKLLDRRQYFMMPVHVLRYYDDAWSEFAVAPPRGVVQKVQ